MKFICDNKLLSDAVTSVSRAVSTTGHIPILSGILIQVRQGNVMLTGYNLELAITTNIMCTVLEDGEIVIQARMFAEMLRKSEVEEVMITATENFAIKINTGNAEFNIMGMNPTDFPKLPTIDNNQSIVIKSDVLKEIIDTTIYAVSRSDSRPALTGQLLVLEPESLTIVALDGFRLALGKKAINFSEELRIIIPQKAMQEISRLIVKSDIDVIPTEYTTKAVVNTRNFINCIERTSVMITEKTREPLIASFSENISLRCKTNLGEVNDELDAAIDGKEVTIAFNNKYLLEALRNSKAENVVLEITSALNPIKIISQDNNDFIHLVLPVRF